MRESSKDRFLEATTREQPSRASKRAPPRTRKRDDTILLRGDLLAGETETAGESGKRKAETGKRNGAPFPQNL